MRAGSTNHNALATYNSDGRTCVVIRGLWLNSSKVVNKPTCPPYASSASLSRFNVSSTESFIAMTLSSRSASPMPIVSGRSMCADVRKFNLFSRLSAEMIMSLSCCLPMASSGTMPLTAICCFGSSIMPLTVRLPLCEIFVGSTPSTLSRSWAYR